LIDSKEHFKPIVTPFELEIALTRGKEWTGKYSLDFKNILPGLASGINNDENININNEDEEIRFSFISGTLKPAIGLEIQHVDSDSLPLISRNNNMSLISGEAKTADEYLKQRQYKGLEPRIGNTPITKAEKGKAGLAIYYEDE